MADDDARVFTAYEINEIGNRGRMQDALAMAIEAIKGGAEDYDIFFVGASLAFQLGDLDKAAQLINALLTRDPDHANGWILFGRIFEARGDIIRAAHGRMMAENIFPVIREMEEAETNEIETARVEARADTGGATKEEINFDTLTFAEICTRQGYFNKALKIYHDLLKKNPHDAELRRRIEDLTKRLNKE